MDKPLLLPGAEHIALPLRRRRERYLRIVALVVGIIAVLVGAADISSRVADSYLGEKALFEAFAPPAAL